MIVVDASLVAKWLLPEVDSKQALDFMEARAGRLHAPALLLSEVAAAIVRRANAGGSDRAEAAGLMTRWSGICEQGAVTLQPLTTKLVQESAILALDLGHPLPDCVYLALALERGCDLATCDPAFATRAAYRYPQIRLLEEYAA